MAQKLLFCAQGRLRRLCRILRLAPRSQITPRGAHPVPQRAQVAKRIQQIAMRLGIEQAAIILLPVQFDQNIRQLPQHLAAGH